MVFPFLIKRLNQLQKMLQMPDILTNTSFLIALDRIGRLEILKSLYGQVYCTEEVAVEFGADDIPNWIIVHRVTDRTRIGILRNLIDPGEASLLALALERQDSILILDDLKARKLAANLNLRLTGLIGVLVRAHRLNIIDSLEAEFTALKAAGFRFLMAIEAEALRLASLDELN